MAKPKNWPWRHLHGFEHKCPIHKIFHRARCGKTQKSYRVWSPGEGLSNHFAKGSEAMAVLLLREIPAAVLAYPVAPRSQAVNSLRMPELSP
jgi:hypothetical protein